MVVCKPPLLAIRTPIGKEREGGGREGGPQHSHGARHALPFLSFGVSRTARPAGRPTNGPTKPQVGHLHVNDYFSSFLLSPNRSSISSRRRPTMVVVRGAGRPAGRVPTYSVMPTLQVVLRSFLSYSNAPFAPFTNAPRYLYNLSTRTAFRHAISNGRLPGRRADSAS